MSKKNKGGTKVGEPAKDEAIEVAPPVEGGADGTESKDLTTEGSVRSDNDDQTVDGGEQELQHAKDSDLEPLPTVEELLGKGFSREQADTIIKGWTLYLKGPTWKPEHSMGAALRVTCPREGGMWRIGRKFSKTPTTILLSELTKEERAILEACDPKHIKVEKINC